MHGLRWRLIHCESNSLRDSGGKTTSNQQQALVSGGLVLLGLSYQLREKLKSSKYADTRDEIQLEGDGSTRDRHRIVAVANLLCNMRPHDKRNAQSSTNYLLLPYDSPPCLPLLPLFTSGESESKDNEQATKDNEQATKDNEQATKDNEEVQPPPLFNHMHIMQLK
jgi:hypothetical protein